MRTILLVAVAAALVQDPAKSGGKVEWGRDPAAAEKRAKLEQRAVFLYFTDGGMPSKALDAGAFSSDNVVSVSRRLLPVMVECPDDKAHADLRSRFKVSQFPSLVILEPDGKTSFEISAREAGELAAELTKTARRFPGRDVLWLSSVEKALEAAKDEPRPVAIYFHAASEDLGDAQDRVVKVLTQGRVDKFLWVELSATMDDKDALKEKYRYYSLPAVAVLDPRFEEPRWLTTFEVPAKAKPKDVQEKVDTVLKKYKDTKIKK